MHAATSIFRASEHDLLNVLECRSRFDKRAVAVHQLHALGVQFSQRTMQQRHKVPVVCLNFICAVR